MGTVSEARSIGLAISERISEEGLEFIRRNDPNLYEDIMKRKPIARRRRK